ncbi:ABATE domain-containing protein [Microbacterium enclense]|uniref:ABATE domain-containing protein n=1 Tax=Microbacterium enclense TaxID=993073 RepID=UPI0009E755BA
MPPHHASHRHNLTRSRVQGRRNQELAVAIARGHQPASSVASSSTRPAVRARHRRAEAVSGVLAGPLTERFGSPVERIPTPARLADRPQEVNLAADACSPDDVAAAVELREAIHIAVSAQTVGQPRPRVTVKVNNGLSARRGAVAVLAEDGRRR